MLMKRLNIQTEQRKFYENWTNKYPTWVLTVSYFDNSSTNLLSIVLITGLVEMLALCFRLKFKPL